MVYLSMCPLIWIIDQVLIKVYNISWPSALLPISNLPIPLKWRHNDHGGVSNHQPHGCLLNRLFRRRSKKTSQIRVTGLCVGNSSGPVNSPHKGPVTRKMFPFDDVIMRFKDLKRVPPPHTAFTVANNGKYVSVDGTILAIVFQHQHTNR